MMKSRRLMPSPPSRLGVGMMPQQWPYPIQPGEGPLSTLSRPATRVPNVRFGPLGRLCSEPVDDLPAGRLPHPLAGADMEEHLVKMPDAPGLADDPGVQMQDHHPPGAGAVSVETVEPLAPQQIDFVDRPSAVQVDVIVVEILRYAERVEFAGPRRHPVGLLVVAPVADIA